MAPSTRRLSVVLVLSLALLSNTFWLFPADGATRYTYERSELVPKGDDIEYRPPVDPTEGSFYNDLAGVGCESVFGRATTDRDLTARTCAFEQSVADDGPVTIDRNERVGLRIGYVELDGGYYHRTVTARNDSVTLGLEPLSAGAVLENVSTDGLGGAELERIERSRVAARAVVSGVPVTSQRAPRDVAVGQVYVDDGAYYAVFVTDSAVVDSPVPDPLRLAFSFVGFVGLFSAVLLLAARVDVEEW